MQIFAKGIWRVNDSRNPLKSVSEEISVLNMAIWISSTRSIGVELTWQVFLQGAKPAILYLLQIISLRQGHDAIQFNAPC